MKVLLYISLLFCFNAISQGDVGYIYEEMPLDSVYKRTIKTHSSLKPTIRLSSQEKNFVSLSGLADVNYLQQNSAQYKAGLGIGLLSTINKKWYFRVNAIQGISNTDSIFKPKSYVLDPQKDYDLYTDIRARASYTPNHIFNFQIGLDNNFIGEGSRSMLLSDYGTPYPFAQIRANFWRVEYAVMYQFLREQSNNRWQGKFAASHHISLNITDWLNFGLFESVVFQPKDTLLNRGFDVEYLNPLVLYRPQEYSLGSSDNVLLGFDLSARWKGHTFYSQFVLDEFYLAEIKAKSGWWANKFGGQVGVKGRFGVENNWFYRLEYNFARPYTYSHLSEELNYGNQGTVLAHPYGANFMEILAEVKWQKNRIYSTLFANYFVTGHNKDGYNYGANIYDSYVDRPYEYDHYIGQGNQLNGINVVSTVGYKLFEKSTLNVFMENHLRYRVQENTAQYMLVIGIRSPLWNDYRNY